jgi:hypothetical protein
MTDETKALLYMSIYQPVMAQALIVSGNAYGIFAEISYNEPRYLISEALSEERLKEPEYARTTYEDTQSSY